MVESTGISELRSEIAELRDEMDRGDALVADTVAETVFPLLEKHADTLSSVVKKLDELEKLLHRLQSLAQAERDLPIDLPSPLRSMRPRRDAN
jgi:hypothetical protein